MGNSIVIEAGGSDLWAIVAIVISVLTGGFSIFWSYHSEKRGYLDNFWFREITAPNCINPALALRSKWSAKLESMANSAISKADYQLIIGDLESDIASAIEGAWVSRIFQGDLFSKIRENYEKVLDVVAEGLQKHVDSPNPVTASSAVGLSSAISVLMIGVLAEAAMANSSSLKIVKRTNG